MWYVRTERWPETACSLFCGVVLLLYYVRSMCVCLLDVRACVSYICFIR